MTISLLLAAAAIAFFALWATDDTNAQITVPPILLALLFLAVPPDLRAVCGGGLLLGVVAYAIFFVRKRGRRVAMPEYAGASEPLSATATDETANAGEPTPSTPDGPYYIPGTPRKERLAADGTAGEPMRFQGRIRSEEGRPVGGAAIEIWHADGNGDYDNEHWNCRGHQFTDADGGFAFETVRPFGYGKKSWSMAGVVDYRSAHLHVKIRHEGRTFTSQLWFPEDERNATDIAYARFAKTNVLDVEGGPEGWTSRFDFVLEG